MTPSRVGVSGLIVAALLTAPPWSASAQVPADILALDGDLPAVVTRIGPLSPVFALPPPQWDKRILHYPDGRSVTEELLSRDARTAIGRITRSEHGATVLFNSIGPLQITTFLRAPSRIRVRQVKHLWPRSESTHEAPQLPPIAGVTPADLVRRWRVDVRDVAFAEGVEARARIATETLDVSTEVTGISTEHVAVNGISYTLPAYRVRVVVAEGEGARLIQTHEVAYIPALAALTVTEAFGNGALVSDRAAQSGVRTTYQVAPKVLQVVRAAAVEQ